MPEKIVLNLGEKGENKFKAYAPRAIGLLLIATISSTVGFFAGQWDSRENFFGLEKKENQSPTREGWQILDRSKFSIEHPENWKSEESNDADTSKVKIYNEEGQLEILLNSLAETRFSKDQREKIKSQTVSEVQIDERKGTQTEFVFNNGEFFIFIILPSTDKKVLTTLSLAANNAETKSQGLEIIKTFKSKPWQH